MLTIPKNEFCKFMEDYDELLQLVNEIELQYLELEQKLEYQFYINSLLIEAIENGKTLEEITPVYH